jgi:CheY-like chemotaxis protein
VYGSVTQSSGFIRLESEPGSGSTFHIHYPRVPAATDAREATPNRWDSTGRSATVLLVEDEEVVRQLAVTLLERAGFRVRAAADGSEALKLFDGSDPEIDVLVTDMVMPGVGGRELAERILERHPRLAVVFMSGYTEDAPVLEGATVVPPTFLRKPFRPQALVKAVREAADQAAPREEGPRGSRRRPPSRLIS